MRWVALIPSYLHGLAYLRHGRNIFGGGGVDLVRRSFGRSVEFVCTVGETPCAVGATIRPILPFGYVESRLRRDD